VLGGLDAFLPYIRDYVQTFTGRSITTWDWKAHLLAYYEKNGTAAQVAALNKVDWDAWFYGEGLSLPVKPVYDDTLAKPPYELAEKWDRARAVDVSALTFTPADVAAFDSNQKVVFLERLATYAHLPSPHLLLLGTLYAFAETQNAEVRLRYYNVALKHAESAAAAALAERAVQWVTGLDGTGVIKGRMKFCRPVFRAVSRVDAVLAQDYFSRTKDAFHPIARKLIEKDLA